MKHNWYVAPEGLPFNVHVYVQWEGREFIAARVRHPKSTESMWVAVSPRGDFTKINMDGRILWRPKFPEKWQMPLPVPVTPSNPGVMFSTTHQLKPEGENEPADVASQWWRDITRIEYQEMGEVRQQMAEGRIMRALVLDRQIRMDGKKCKTNAAVLADLKASLLDILEQAPLDDWMPPLVPLEQDHRDYLTVMEWMTEFECTWREVRALRRRCQFPPASWRQIGDEIGRTGEAARKMYLATIEGLTKVANKPAKKAAKKLSALQERNRAAKRRP